MSDRSGCTHLCNLNARSDYGLVLKIMGTVEHHNSDEHIVPDPRSLRDTMLAVAALLHVEAIKMDEANSHVVEKVRERLHEAFGSAACRQLDAVVEAAALIRRDQSGKYQ
jgi:hypothetical protein